MAEQSIGMTTGAGDGVIGGYTNTRMTAKDYKSIGNGILLTGDVCAVTGQGTSTINIAAGAIMNNGFFYENTTALTISVSGVGSNTYFLVNRVNDTGSAVTVVMASGGATTIAARTVRCALVTQASYNTLTDIMMATVTVSGGIATTIRQQPQVASSQTFAPQIWGRLQKTTAQTLVTPATWYTMTWDSMSAAGNPGLSMTPATNTVNVVYGGLWQVSGYITVSQTNILFGYMEFTMSGPGNYWLQPYDARAFTPVTAGDLKIPISTTVINISGDYYQFKARAYDANIQITGSEIIITKV